MILDIRRHMELFNPYNFHEAVNIIGCGATGSWVALYLAKLGLENITVYDFDKIEEHNIPNQAFGIHDVGRDKAMTIVETIRHQTGTSIKDILGKYTNQRLRGVVFLMVDSMAERKRIWEESIKYNPNVTLLIEPRMGLSMGRVYSINPCNLTQINAYEATLYSDEDAEVSACGSSVSVITSATMIASMCVRQMINFTDKEEEIDNEILIDMKYWNIVKNIWK